VRIRWAPFNCLRKRPCGQKPNPWVSPLIAAECAPGRRALIRGRRPIPAACGISTIDVLGAFVFPEFGRGRVPSRVVMISICSSHPTERGPRPVSAWFYPAALLPRDTPFSGPGPTFPRLGFPIDEASNFASSQLWGHGFFRPGIYRSLSGAPAPSAFPKRGPPESR